jgi:hypothetical protein
VFQTGGAPRKSSNFAATVGKKKLDRSSPATAKQRQNSGKTRRLNPTRDAELD